MTIHIAGVADGATQRCTRCHTRIDAGDGCMTMDGKPPRHWEPGTFVGMGDGFAIQMDHDAEEPDEEKCQ